MGGRHDAICEPPGATRHFAQFYKWPDGENYCAIKSAPTTANLFIASCIPIDVLVDFSFSPFFSFRSILNGELRKKKRKGPSISRRQQIETEGRKKVIFTRAT